jgi:hypothetical protein
VSSRLALCRAKRDWAGPRRMKPNVHRRDLLLRVEARRTEIVQAILARVHSVGTGGINSDAEYLAGVRAAVETAIDHTILAAGTGDEQSSSVPDPVLAQTRLAARRRTPLDRVLRRYLAGHSVLSDFIVEEAERCGASARVLRQVLRSQAAETDRIVALISDAYRQEVDAMSSRPAPKRLAERVRGLLAGELLDPAGLGYEFARWHVGFAVQGGERQEVIQDIVSRFDAVRLVVDGDAKQVWAWVGLRNRPAPAATVEGLRTALPDGVEIGVGEPGRGAIGWRLTHEQAKGALTVVMRREDQIARYADVALLAAALRDELLTSSLKALYVDPLNDARDGGGALRHTLRAYLWADRNVTSTAAALGVSRNTVHNRLRTIEARIGQLRPIHSADLVLALQLDELLRNKVPNPDDTDATH